MHIISRDPGPPPISYIKVSGGIFLDMSIHDFDMARFLIGDEVESVYTTAAVRVDPEIGKAGDLDTALIVLQFKSGAIATIDNSRKAVYGYDQRVEIFGSAGSDCYRKLLIPIRPFISTATEIRRDLPLNFFMERYTESFISEDASVCHAVLQRQTHTSDGVDGRLAVLMGVGGAQILRRAKASPLEEVAALGAFSVLARRKKDAKLI